MPKDMQFAQSIRKDRVLDHVPRDLTDVEKGPYETVTNWAVTHELPPLEDDESIESQRQERPVRKARKDRSTNSQKQGNPRRKARKS